MRLGAPDPNTWPLSLVICQCATLYTTLTFRAQNFYIPCSSFCVLAHPVVVQMCDRGYEFEDASLSPLKIAQHPDGRDGHASTVWDAALVMCAFLESEMGRQLISGTLIVELGSGTGICAIAASILGATCVATDLEPCIPALRHNISLNPQATSCTAECLDWYSATPRSGVYDWVLCADCVYLQATVPALVSTIAALGPRRGVIYSNERRTAAANARAEALFLQTMAELGYASRAVSRASLRPEWRCEDIDVVVFERGAATPAIPSSGLGGPLAPTTAGTATPASEHASPPVTAGTPARP